MSSPKTSAPVVGFNHNLKFGPRIYHVQTEDSGLPHAHYITHLFVGGNILASIKSSYADRLDDPDLARTVRSLMEAQHKSMVKRLVAGEFNDRAQLFAPHYEPGVLATGQTGPAAVNVAKSAPAQASSMSGAPLVTPSGGTPKVAPRPAPQAPQRQPAAAPPPAARPPARPAQPSVMAPPALNRPPPARPSQPMTTAPRPNVPTSPPQRMPGAPLPTTTRPPPPQARPATIPPVVTPVGTRPVAPPLSHNPFAPPPAPPEPKPVEAPTDGLPTLFAEELISEKSLDEVILAFLSADLEQGK